MAKEGYYTEDGRKIKNFFKVGTTTMCITETNKSIFSKNILDLAKSYDIKLQGDAESVDEELLRDQLDMIHRFDQKFPEVRSYLEKHDQDLCVRIIDFTQDDNHKNDSQGDVGEDNIIYLNSKSNILSQSKEKAQDYMNFLTNTPEGILKVLSTNNVAHAAAHEFSHIIQHILADKEDMSVGFLTNEILRSVNKRSLFGDLSNNISAVGNQVSNELISEALADVVINNQNCNIFSRLIYNEVKRRFAR